MATDPLDAHGSYLPIEDVLQFIGNEPRTLHRPSADQMARDQKSREPAPTNVSAPTHRENIRSKSAIALGGLAGNNAHGAGFLEALRQTAKVPQLISCTSGQILWTYWYLKGEDLRSLFKRQLGEYQPFGRRLDLNLLYKIADNEDQRIRLSTTEFPGDIVDLYYRSLSRFFADPLGFSFFREAVNLWPARSLVNQDKPGLYEDMAACFNSEENVGIIFNAYDFKKGVEIVYLNKAATRLTGKSWNSVNKRRSWVVYKPISAESIKDALWLYEYGFDKTSTMLDGAYFRDIILSEIPGPSNQIDRIAVIRPIFDSWLGEPPRTWAELKDMQTEVSFNGTYAGERERVRDMNHVPDMKKIGILELPLMKQRGWWDYIFEDQQVFDAAFERGRSLLRYL